MSSKLRIRYDSCQEEFRAAQARTAELKTQYDQALEAETLARKKLEEVRSTLDRALEIADQPPIIQQAQPQKPKRSTDGVSPSVRATIDAFSRDGEVSLSELRQQFADLSEGAVSARLQEAKNAKLVESAGWGRYRLTQKGRQATSNLRIVS